MSNLDTCLFFRISEGETTYVAIFVDDKFIFTNNIENARRFVERMKKHFEVTLNEMAESFLGIHFEKLTDGSVLLTQPKLLQKLFKLYPSLRHRRRKPAHPYGPEEKSEERDESPIISSTQQYMTLLGLLGCLTKSRPDILAAVSFGATKSSKPTYADFVDLMEIVDYLRDTSEKGHRIYAHDKKQNLQFICSVDASILPATCGQQGPHWVFNRNKSRRYILLPQR